MLDDDIKESHNPKNFIKELDRYIVGQKEAKEALATLMFVRAVRMSSPHLDLPDLKSNLLLIGPTGTGKTSLIKAVSKISGLPIPVFDITGLTTQGFIGGNVEDILERLIDEYKYFIEDANLDLGDEVSNEDLLINLVENGIVYLDEIDKLSTQGAARTSSGVSHNQSVQNELLKFFEGANVSVSVAMEGKKGKKSDILIDTSNISFICGGAFSGLDEIIFRRKNEGQSIGFNSDINVKSDKGTNPDKLLKYVTNDDLVEYGMMREVVGRLALRATLSPLHRDDFIKIMSTVDNNIVKQYRNLFGELGKKLVVEQEAKEEIADFCLGMKTGARSLKFVMQKLLNDYLINVLDNKDKTIRISKRDVVKILGALNEKA